MKPKWQKLASLTQEIYTPKFQFFGAVFASKGCPFTNTFDFTTAGDWDCVAAVERLPALHYRVNFIFLSFGSWVSLWNFKTIRGSLMKPKWQKLASPGESLSPCPSLWGTLHTGDDIDCNTCLLWEDPPVCHGWLSHNSKGTAWKTESMQNMDVYKFCMTQHVSLASLTG